MAGRQGERRRCCLEPFLTSTSSDHRPHPRPDALAAPFHLLFTHAHLSPISLVVLIEPTPDLLRPTDAARRLYTFVSSQAMNCFRVSSSFPSNAGTRSDAGSSKQTTVRLPSPPPFLLCRRRLLGRKGSQPGVSDASRRKDVTQQPPPARTRRGSDEAAAVVPCAAGR